MPLILPSLTDPRFLGLTLCGHFTSPPDNLIELLGGWGDDGAIAKADVGGQAAILAFRLHGTSPRNLHLDYVNDDRVAFQPPEKAKAPPMDELRCSLDSTFGFLIQGYFLGRYKILADDLPDDGILSYSRFRAGAGQVTAAAISGEIAMTGFPVSRLRWSQPDDREAILIELKGKFKVAIGESYLTDCRNLLDLSLEAIVYGRSGHVTV